MKYISLFSLLFILFSCKNQPQETPAVPVEVSGGLIRLSAEQLQRASVSWGEIEKKSIRSTLALSGELRIAPENKAAVSASSDGFVTLLVRRNQNVRKGELIATLRKADLIDLQQDYLETRDRNDFLQAEYTRLKSLKDDQATADKNVQKAAAELRAGRTTQQLLAAKLQFIGIDPASLTLDNLRSELRILAPLSGTVTAVHLSSGTAVQAGAALCDLADFTALQADLFVYEKDILKVKTGQRVTISFPGSPDQLLQATVSSIDRVLDPVKNALRIHARLDQKTGLHLVDGAYCNALLALEGDQSMPVVPADAIVREGLEEYILLLEKQENGAAFFRPLAVRSLASEQGMSAFSSDSSLASSAQVVRKGAYFVWSQGKVE